MNRLILLAAAALVALPASAQKFQPQSPLELGVDPTPEMAADGASFADGRPALLAGLNLYVSPGSPEQMAREALAQTGGTLGVAASAVDGLEMTET